MGQYNTTKLTRRARTSGPNWPEGPVHYHQARPKCQYVGKTNLQIEDRLGNRNSKSILEIEQDIEAPNRNSNTKPILSFYFGIRIRFSNSSFEFRVSISTVKFEFRFRVSSFDFEYPFRVSISSFALEFRFPSRSSIWSFVFPRYWHLGRAWWQCTCPLGQFGHDVLALRSSLVVTYWPFWSRLTKNGSITFPLQFPSIW